MKSEGATCDDHRVIGADNSLTGYAGGLERKRMLLAHEAGARAPLFAGDSSHRSHAAVR